MKPEGAVAYDSWASLLAKSACLVAIVTLPLLFLAPSADHRFHPYRYGGEYASHPWSIVGDEFRNIDRYLSFGNFRPFGRILERSLDVFAYSIGTSLNMPIHVGLRMSHILAMITFALTMVLVAQSLTQAGGIFQYPPGPAASLVAVAFPAGLVAAGRGTAVVLFADLYFLSGTLVLLTALVIGRHEWQVAQGISARLAFASFAVGSFLAAFNEVAYLALPVALLLVLIRNWSCYWTGLERFLRSRSFLTAAAALIGFITMLVPVRLIIADRCSAGGCYYGSEIAVREESISVVAHRLASANPYSGWSAATNDVSGLWFLTSNPVLIGLAVVCVVVAYRTVVPALRRMPHEPNSRGLVALLLFGIGLAAAAGLMAGASANVQGFVANWPVGSGWRDAQLLAGAWALVAASLVAAIGKASTRAGHVTASVVLAMACIASMLANEAVARIDTRRVDSSLHVRIGTELTLLSKRPEAVDRRCGLLVEFRELHPERADWHARLEEALDAAARERIGSPFCPHPD